MKRLSLILNSRRRTEFLYGLLASIVSKTANLEDIEIFINFDSDDRESLKFISDLYDNNKTSSPIALIRELDLLKFEFRQRDGQLTKNFNRMYEQSTGEYLFNLNDDASIETQNWDSLTYPILKEFGPIVYGRTQCNSVDHHPTEQYSSFPIISRKGCDCLGYFFPDHIAGLGGDVVIYKIYEGANKVVNTPVFIRHLTHESLDLVFNPDETAREFRALNSDQLAWSTDVTKEIEKLKENNV